MTWKNKAFKSLLIATTVVLKGAIEEILSFVTIGMKL